MRAESALGVAMVVVLLASLVVAAVVPGAIAGPEEEPGRVFPERPPTVAVAEVGPETVTLNVSVFLAHRGGRSENVTVGVRATHLESGLHATTRTVAVDPIEGDREVTVPVHVTVPREGGYHLAVFVVQDGERERTVEREVRGVGELQPPYARSSVEFHRFDRRVGNDTLPAVQASVAERADGEAALDVSAYLTNARGDETSDLEVEFVLRRAESGIVVARARVPVGSIRAGRTATPSTTVTVADGVNYYVDAILWRDGVVVDSARGVANLDADRAIHVNRTDEGGGLQVSDVEDGRAGAGFTSTPAPAATPGFGPLVAVAALLGALAVARRYA